MKAAIYCRSRKDKPSPSVTEQQMLLIPYMISLNLDLYAVYVDDGVGNYSAYEQMLKDCQHYSVILVLHPEYLPYTKNHLEPNICSCLL